MEKIILENPFLTMASMALAMALMFYVAVFLYTIRHRINWFMFVQYCVFGWLFVILAGLDGFFDGLYKLYKTATHDIVKS